ncbi:GDSL-type esterase/lipase family protein [Bifidobacterium sp.]|jgi:hypothetical protein|uniref:GDSL-type esterase/lipase family protein n=1 Tax=Bifidobacterium sp. TaxID=41200 RepID=UPI0025BB39E5|nr:GDSL-type esterase/lipase family protein [Bifidobacterium sp.]MCH4209310.1 GDSL-type esterase/lipase family protein [Bifidobacterium sp.]MCI1224104.1 GDSL-type esterase/lipase family protein [Bifidobacterium sp.]
MAYSCTAAEMTAFLDGVADVVPGPLGGVMPHRIARRYRSQIRDPWFVWNEFCPSGVHLNVHISAPATLTLAGYALEEADNRLSVATRDGQGTRITDISVRSAGRLVPDLESRTFSLRPGVPMHIDLAPADGGDGTFCIMLPHTCLIELIGMRSQRTIDPADAPGTIRWTHYGSSISHGAQTPSPSRRWPEQVARALGLHLRDYSLSGNAQMDPCMARAIGETPSDIITCAIGINIVNADSMRERFFVPALHGFLDTIRDKQPHTPIILSTACYCPIQKRNPGPIVMQPDGNYAVAERNVADDAGALTLQRTRDLIAAIAQERDDPQLTVADGREFFGPADAGLLVDKLHPGPEGIDLMAGRIAAALGKAVSSIRRTS